MKDYSKILKHENKPWFSKCMVNFFRNDIPRLGTVETSIVDSVWWAGTPEGHEFWEEIHDQLTEASDDDLTEEELCDFYHDYKNHYRETNPEWFI